MTSDGISICVCIESETWLMVVGMRVARSCGDGGVAGLIAKRAEACTLSFDSDGPVSSQRKDGMETIKGWSGDLIPEMEVVCLGVDVLSHRFETLNNPSRLFNSQPCSPPTTTPDISTFCIAQNLHLLQWCVRTLISALGTRLISSFSHFSPQ